MIGAVLRRIGWAWARRRGRPDLLYKRLAKPSPREHADFLRDTGEFRHIGEGTEIMIEASITDPYLTHIGSHSYLSQCFIFGHDGSSATLEKAYGRVLDNVGPVIVGDYCFIGHGSILMPGTTIGDRCVIGAGAIVKGSIPDGSVVGGVPGRVIGSTAELAASLREKTEALPWLELLERRTPENFMELEPELVAQRIRYFFPE